ncbi:mechanosensitive ion channel family protein [Nitrospina gracilis]|uniref:mechanosensitive ion channel family protein n=1 Tax=Nitrospina gracilis TaxID=35801 RepID=UPI001F00AD0B|nr:mechanosensitive ion channel family protein [Nitrospina gracilis]MCF8720155.1 putative nucleic acid-binding Zn-ribbon protein [Nitrospina gracilis Nb-211]
MPQNHCLHFARHPHFLRAVFLIALLLAALAFPVPAPAQSGEAPSGDAPPRQNVQKMLFLLSKQITQVQSRLKALNDMPATPSVNKKREELLSQIDGLQRNFESLATQLSADQLFEGDPKKSDWSQKLESLIMPLLEATSDLTEKPRRIENLKTRIELLGAQLRNYEEGRKNIEALLSTARQEREPLDEQEQQFLMRLENLKDKYNPELIRLKLHEARRALKKELANSEPFIDTATRSIKNFFKHRGLNLLISAGIFIAIWYLLIKLRLFIVGEKSLFSFEPWMQKVLMTAYTGLVLVLCIISSLVSLYLLNDWLLLSIVILFLLAVAWASRQFIPRLFQEMRLALNLGTVKENERLIWKGVPWYVEGIGLQAALKNPSLEAGSVLLPVGELVGQHSRPVVEDEPWFPTEVGDWVILADGTYGRVQHQTMEQVVLELKGGTEHFYTTTDFLSKTPKNISRGFRYDIVFGLDYETQPRVCDEIPGLFSKGLREHLKNHFQEGEPDFTHLEITFDEAGSSSLNLRVVVHVDGRCAEWYDELKREIQTALVRICNENRLRIPFTQLTVTLSDNSKQQMQTASQRKDDPPSRV